MHRHLSGVLAFAIIFAGPDAARGQVSAKGRRTINAIADTLDRLGEGNLANQLRTDMTSGKVTFGVIRDYGVFRNPDTTAEVRAGKSGYGGADTNTLKIANRHENEGNTMKPGRRYDPNSSSFILPLASTMVHEYEHMRQTFPQQGPKWEDPAYRVQEAAVGRWIQKLSAEIDSAAQTRAGTPRATSLRETTDLLRSIRSECGSLIEAIAVGEQEKNLWITPRKNWQYANYIKLIDRQLERAAALEPGVAEWDPAAAGKPSGAVATPAPPIVKVPPQGAWLLFDSKVWSSNPNIEQAVLEYGSGFYAVKGTVLPGISRHTWVNPNREGRPTTSLAVTWTLPTDMVPQGGEIIVTATAADTGSSAGAAESDFVSFAIGLHGTNDDKAWTFLAGNYPQLTANPRKQDARTYRIPAPGTKYGKLVLDISTGNIFWDKVVRYEYLWKDGTPAPRGRP